MPARDINPERRWHALLKAVDKGKPPKKGSYLLDVYNVVVGKAQDTDIEYALDIVRVREHREVIQAFLYCESTLERISEVLEIDLRVLEHVEKLVMDSSQFRNKLERLTYVRKLLHNDKALSDHGRECVQMGLTHGPEILSHHFRMGNEDIKIDPKKMIEHFIVTAYYLSANARGNSITADVTKQSRLWMQDSIKYLEARKDAEGGIDADSEAMMAIEERQATISAEDLGIDPSDIYH